MNARFERREIASLLPVRFHDLRPIFCFVQSFHEALRHLDGKELLALLLATLERKNRFTILFVQRLLKEAEGLRNACERTGSNGPVNRFKFIKRTMYGRASFDLLRIKMLYHFFYYYINISVFLLLVDSV